MLSNKFRTFSGLTLLLFLTLALTFLSGCGSQKSDVDPFVGGTNGLLINFVEGAPPQTVFDDGQSPFQVIVHLENDGEYTIPRDKVRVTLLGFNPVDFGLTGGDIVKHPDSDIEGVTKDLLNNQKRPGGQTDIVFPDFNYASKIQTSTSYPIIAEVCYYYQTIAKSNLCVRRNLLSQDDTVCKINEQKPVYCSGAPVKVTSFQEGAAGNNKVQFTFNIEQKGNGDVFEKDSDCGSGTLIGKRNKVYVTVDTGLPGLKCHNLIGGDTSGFVTLSAGKASVDCVQTLTDLQSDFKQPVTITLGYDFKDTKSVNILVRPSE